MCNAVVWVLGFVLYRVLMTVDIPVGNTPADTAGTMLLCLIAHKIVPDKTRGCLKPLRKIAKPKTPAHRASVFACQTEF